MDSVAYAGKYTTAKATNNVCDKNSSTSRFLFLHRRPELHVCNMHKENKNPSDVDCLL